MMMTATKERNVCIMDLPSMPMLFCISHDTMYSESKVLLLRVWLHLHARCSRWDMNKLNKFQIYSLRSENYLYFRFVFQRSQEAAPINSSCPGVITFVITMVITQGQRSADVMLKSTQLKWETRGLRAPHKKIYTFSFSSLSEVKSNPISRFQNYQNYFF